MNKKVPFAILSCFLIAFVLQGVLKLCGIFVFEKVLDWGIFRIIDNNIILNILYYSIVVFIIMYCLSFAFTSRPYSNKWWYYVIIAVVAVTDIIIKRLILIPIRISFICDIIKYIIVPVIINITTDNKYKVVIKNKLTNVILIITMQILLYFCYLGLNYWSTILTSFIPISQTFLQSSTIYLIYSEIFIGLITLTITMNILIYSIKEEKNMHYPIDIASDEAKEKELQEHKERLENKKKK